MGIHIIPSDSLKNSFFSSFFVWNYSELLLQETNFQFSSYMHTQARTRPKSAISKIALSTKFGPQKSSISQIFDDFFKKSPFAWNLETAAFLKIANFAQICKKAKFGRLTSPKNCLWMEILVDLGCFALYQWNMLPTSIVDLPPWDSQLTAIKIPWWRHQVEIGSVGLLE